MISLFQSNGILAAFPIAEQERLHPQLELVSIRFTEVLCKRDEVTQYVYFPVYSVVSLQTPVPDRPSVALSMIGREGMTGVDVALGSEVSQFNIVVLGAGSALRMKAAAFVTEFHQSEPIRQVVLYYADSFKNLIAQTALCLRFHSTEARLAHLMLATSDYLFSDRFVMSQASLGDMLGVRRTVICRVAKAFKLRGLIDYSRADIRIADRVQLISLACSCYRPKER